MLVYAKGTENGREDRELDIEYCKDGEERLLRSVPSDSRRCSIGEDRKVQ